MRKIRDGLVLTLATGFGVSLLPARLRVGKRWTGAGTLGTLWGLLTWRFVPASPGRQLAVLAAAVGLSILICGEAERLLGAKDDQRIVLDEWVGYWTAAAFLPRTGALLAAAFILFRFFDMWKGPWGRAVSRWPGGRGVVLDDVLAGFGANLTLQAFRFFLSF